MWSQYADFTDERRTVLEKMGDFFEKTVRENFPAKTDASSYKAFFNCIFVDGAVHESLYILQVDRQKLAEINADLFKDENYYFFYARYVAILDTGNISIHDCTTGEHDSVPTIRYCTSRIPTDMWWWYDCPHNRYGYMKRLTEQYVENPVICSFDTLSKAAGDFYMNSFVPVVLNNKLQEMSDPVVKQLAAVFFWRHICFCGGVDLVRRKRFCAECEFVK
jgi:hypothetical protein